MVIFRKWRKYYIFPKTKIEKNIIFSIISDIFRNKLIKQDNGKKDIYCTTWIRDIGFFLTAQNFKLFGNELLKNWKIKNWNIENLFDNMNYPRRNLIYLKQVHTFQSNLIKFENLKCSLPLKRFIVRFLATSNLRICFSN